ncbi:hypothetical protein [Bacillus paranthracis]|nr:hypothetical protein [Bacillus paranthracis]
MTVIASVKTCLASVRGAQASFDLQNRVSVLEREEPQYKGF